MPSRALLAVAVSAGLLLSGCGSTAQVAGVAGPGTPGAPGGELTDGLGSAPVPGAPEAPTPGAAGPSLGPLPVTAGPGRPGTLAPGGGTAAPRPAAGASTTGPVKGRGFDATTVRVGFEYLSGGDELFASAGFNLTTGDMRAMAQTVVDDANRRGGLLGRKIVPVFQETGAVEGAGNPAATAQAACTAFLDDNTVFAAVSISDTSACLSKAGVPNAVISTLAVDDPLLRTTAPWHYRPLTFSYTRLVPLWVDRLVAQRYLTPGVKVGLLYPGNGVGGRVRSTVEKALKAKGFDVAATYGYDSSSATSSAGDVPNAVLPFRSAGVDRVLATDASVSYFMTAAEQQGYRPRYGLNSYMNLQSVLASVPPKAQLAGAVGIGWLGANDVAEQRLDRKPPSYAACKDLIARSGQTASGFALVVLLATCDHLRLMFFAAQQGGGLDPASVRAGFARSGRDFPSALVLRSAMSDTRFDGALGARDVAWGTECQCFAYQGSTVHLTS